jgi:hypothetical protein
MSLAGQVLWKRKVVVCAVLIIGAASAAAPVAPTAVFFKNWRRFAGVLEFAVIKVSPRRLDN